MARSRILRESRIELSDRFFDDLDLGDDELPDLIEEGPLGSMEEESLDVLDELTAWDCVDDDEAWCDCAPWIEDELRSALWWSLYANLRRRRRMH